MAEKINKMPVNYDAEKALLACIMIDTNCSAEYVTQLKEEDFALPQNKEIYKAIRLLANDNKPIDALTVADKLSMTNRLNEAGGLEYITGISTSIPSSVNADEYYNIVTRNSLLREIINAGVDISKKGYTEENAEGALDYAESRVFNLSETHEASKLQPIAKASADVINKITAIQQGKHNDEGVKTGYALIDKKINALAPGALCILAARPSIGKTAFALTIAADAAIRHNKKVAIFSYEMPVEQLVSRMITTFSQVSLKRQRQVAGLNLSDTQKLLNAHEAMTNSGIYVDDNANNIPADIISKCRRMKNTVGLDLVIIDYLQLISLGEKRESRQQEVSELSRRMKLFAKELNVPFVVLSQLSRGMEQRKEEPQLSDLRESGSIEQDADMVFFLHRITEKNAEKTEEKVVADRYAEDGAKRFIKFIIGKNRNGELGSFYFDWNGDLQTFTPLDITRVKTDDEPENRQKATKVSDYVEDSDAFEGLETISENQKGEVLEIADDEPQHIGVNEAPFDTSDGDMQFSHNESGDQSVEKNEEDIPF